MSVKPRKNVYESQHIRSGLLMALMQMEPSDVVQECIQWIEFIIEMRKYIHLDKNNPPNISLLNTYEIINDIDTIYATLSERLSTLEVKGLKDRQLYKTIEMLHQSAHSYILFRDEPILDDVDTEVQGTGEGVEDLLTFLDEYFDNNPSGAAGPSTKKRRKQVQLRL